MDARTQPRLEGAEGSLRERSLQKESAQNTGSGTIHCIVMVDGKKVEDNKASGLYHICTASGSV